MTDFAMPQSLELEAARRNGIPAVRREVVHNTTTQNEYRPGELCYIPIDTGAAGAFMDTTTTRLEMTIVVRNKNYYTDFINLPRCGWNAIIQEFGVEVNNGLHELNRHYAECIELDMIKRGENRVPFEICKPNPYKVGEGLVGMKHINFVKPSMVTHVGLPHNVKYAPLSTTTANTTPDIIMYGALLQANPFTTAVFGRSSASAISDLAFNDYIDYDSSIGKFMTSNMHLALSSWDDRVSRKQSERRKLSRTATYQAVGSEDLPTVDGEFTNVNSRSRIVGGPGVDLTLGELGQQTAANPYTLLPTTVGQNIYKAAYGQSVTGVSPAQWPAFQPCDWTELQKQVKECSRYVNADNVLTYYANCKNIPIGIPLDLSADSSGSAAIYGDSIHTKPLIDDNGAETEFNVSLKVYSSLIGELTKKWFPELIVPQGRMRIRMRFQEPQILFQTLMDPCRRVPGTSRDWFPYLGLTRTDEIRTENTPSGTAGSVVATKNVGLAGSCSVERLASGIHPAMVSNYNPGFCFSPSIASGQFPIPTLRLRPLQAQQGFGYQNIFDYGGTGTTNSVNAPYYTTVADGQSVVSDFITDQTEAGTFRDFLEFVSTGETNDQALERIVAVATWCLKNQWESAVNTEYGCPWVFHQNHAANGEAFLKATGTDVSVLIGDVQQIQWPSCYRNLKLSSRAATDGGGTTARASTVKDSPGNEYWASVANSNRDRKWKALNYHPYCVPTPQYVPLRSPSNKTSYRILTEDLFLNENQMCFGTHLERSVAQVRRSHSALYPLQIEDQQTSRIDERLTYIVRNIQLVTQQIILPRTAAISIVENALNGGISMETIAWKEMESMLPKSESQKHLINMAAAFCNSLTFVFRPIDTYQGDRAYGYNSFSFYNPFTVFRFDYDSQLTPPDVNLGQNGRSTDYNDLGGKPVFYNECVVANRVAFDIQLQLSTELYPRTPIDTINRLLMHTRWGDQVFSSQDYMELAPALQPSYLTSKGQVINTLQDGYWAAFCPISALDDQTITCNPFLTPLELSLRKRIRGYRAPVDALPIYKPYDGTFHLSFNLEAFMGQNGRMRTGVPIVNNNMFIRMEKCHLLREYDTQLLTIVECDAKVVFERGGTMQFFT